MVAADKQIAATQRKLRTAQNKWGRAKTPEATKSAKKEVKALNAEIRKITRVSQRADRKAYQTFDKMSNKYGQSNAVDFLRKQ